MVVSSSIHVVVEVFKIPLEMEQHFMVATFFIFPGEWQGLALGEGCGGVAEEGDLLADIVYVVFDLL